MTSIPKSLHSTPDQVFQMFEQENPSSNQNSSFEVDYQTATTQIAMEDSFPDQNQSMEISSFSRQIMEKEFKKSSYSRKFNLSNRGRSSKKQEQKKYDHNLYILGKILFFTFIVCVLLGMCAILLQKSFSDQCSMPTDSSGAQNTLMGLYNSRGNMLNKKIQNKQPNEKITTSKTTSINNLVRKTTPNSASTSFITPTQVNPPNNIIIPEPQCSKSLLQENTQYGSLYTFSVNRNILRQNSNVDYYVERYETQLSKEKFVEAFDLLQVIHNIDEKGNIIAKDTPCESGEALSTRLKATIQKNTERLNRQYNMNSYFHNQLRFCIVSNSYKNAQNGLFYRNIDSILQQNYTNYHVVYTDDNSPDQTGQIVKKYLSEKNISQDKIKVKINNRKVGMMENIYNAITYDCQKGEIAVMLDGDDSFIGTNVLGMLNALYQQKKVALIWNNFLTINFNSKASMGFSRAMNDLGNNFKAYRILRQFVSTHLKSFYVDLFKKIKIQDLQDNVGNFYGGASDTAMMMPMLEMSHPRFEYVPEIVYEYRYDTGQVGMAVNRVPQGIALAKIGLTEPYKSLTDFSFVDQAIAKVQQVNQQNSQKSQTK